MLNLDAPGPWPVPDFQKKLNVSLNLRPPHPHLHCQVILQHHFHPQANC